MREVELERDRAPSAGFLPKRLGQAKLASNSSVQVSRWVAGIPVLPLHDPMTSASAESWDQVSNAGTLMWNTS